MGDESRERCPFLDKPAVTRLRDVPGGLPQ
jgi:hypothetical protein